MKPQAQVQPNRFGIRAGCGNWYQSGEFKKNRMNPGTFVERGQRLNLGIGLIRRSLIVLNWDGALKV